MVAQLGYESHANADLASYVIAFYPSAPLGGSDNQENDRAVTQVGGSFNLFNRG